LVCTIQGVNPSSRLLVDWICSGLDEGGAHLYSTWFHKRAGLSRDSLCTSFLCTSHWAQLYTS
jgi:hypothetical protein